MTTNAERIIYRLEQRMDPVEPFGLSPAQKVVWRNGFVPRLCRGMAMQIIHHVEYGAAHGILLDLVTRWPKDPELFNASEATARRRAKDWLKARSIKAKTKPKDYLAKICASTCEAYPNVSDPEIEAFYAFMDDDMKIDEVIGVVQAVAWPKGRKAKDLRRMAFVVLQAIDLDGDGTPDYLET